MTAVRLRRAPAVVACAAAVAVAVLGQPVASAALPQHGREPAATERGRLLIDDESAMHDCQQLTGPDATATDHVVADGQRISLDVQVVLDVAGAVDVARITDATQRAAAMVTLVDRYRPLLKPGRISYDGLDMNLNYARYHLLRPLESDGTPRNRTTDAQAIIDLAKAQYGGSRPSGFDVVYVLTDLDIRTPSLGNGVVGYADCIGGVTYARRAFAVGEMLSGMPLGPVEFSKDGTAKIAAHEIGHLMGGQHHYQSCGDAVASAVGRSEVGACTLMTNFVDVQTLPFSQLNGIVVRGHATRYAAANDDAPPAETDSTEPVVHDDDRHRNQQGDAPGG